MVNLRSYHRSSAIPFESTRIFPDRHFGQGGDGDYICYIVQKPSFPPLQYSDRLKSFLSMAFAMAF